jgi:CheY-like chemotaxis protein
LAAAEGARFDLVISDLGLPDGTGLELMAKLRDHHSLRGIALSGYGMDEDIRRSHDAGFRAHLTKPIDYAQVERALEDLLGRP